MEIHKKNKAFSFEKIAFSVVIFLGIIIAVLLLFLFNVFPFFSQRKQSVQTNTLGKKSQEKSKTVIVVPSNTAKKISNNLLNWTTEQISHNPIQIVSPVEISMHMSPSFAPTAPASSSAGIIFSNGLEEKNKHARKISLYYYLKNEQWILKFQSGKTVTYYGVLSVPKEKAESTFSLLISSNGKNVLVTKPNKETRLIHFPNSLYDVTNQMTISALTGPKSQITISNLQYQLIHE